MFIFDSQSMSERTSYRRLFDAVLSIFSSTYGEEKMLNEDCVVFNQSDAPYPMTITNQQPIRIRTAALGEQWYAQYVFNLGHELMHYAIRQHKLHKNSEVKWFEETVCEAMAIYVLEHMESHFDQQQYVDVTQNEGCSFMEYARRKYKEATGGALAECKSYEELCSIEQECDSSSEVRNKRALERNKLIDLFNADPDAIREIVNYTNYIIPGTILIDFKKWIRNSSNKESVNLFGQLCPEAYKLSA